jgi:hypothetical protein
MTALAGLNMICAAGTFEFAAIAGEGYYIKMTA